MPQILCNFQLSMPFEDCKYEKVITEETEERARYEYYHQVAYRFWDMPYGQFKKLVQCKNLGLVDVTALFGNEKLFRKMCKRRKIEFAFLGMRVQVAGRMGTIVGNWKMNLFVVFDGDCQKYNVHPHWELAYFDENGKVVRDYRKGSYELEVM